MALAAFGIPPEWMWPGAQRIIRSVFANKRTAVKSGHSMSKDWSAGICAVEWLMRYPLKSKVICTAPKLDQVKLIMIAEMTKQFKAMRARLPFPVEGEPEQSLMLKLGPDWYAFGMTTKETGESMGKFQGFKSPNILIIISEAQSVEDNIFDQIEGMTTSGNAHVLEIGNPMSPQGRFWEHCTQPKFGYNVITMSCFESPNVVSEKELIPGMVTKGWVEERRAEWGEDHPFWYSRVLGEFPQSSTDCVIPIHLIMRQVREDDFLKEIDPEDFARFGGLDVAGQGTDETAFAVLNGPKCIPVRAFHRLHLNEVVGWAKDIYKNEKLAVMGFDNGGLADVGSFLDEDGMSSYAIQFGEALEDNTDFANLGAAMWWRLRQAFETGSIFIPNDPILIGQLASRKYEFTSQGKKKIKLESKGDARLRGKHSPDRADALAMAWWIRFTNLSPVEKQPKFERESTKVQREIEQPMHGAKSTARRKVFELESSGAEI